MNMFKSLKAKLIVSTTMVLVITVIVNLVIGILTSKASITDNVKQDLRSVGTMAEVAISNSLEKIKLGVNSAGSLEYIGDALYSEAAQLNKLDVEKMKYGYNSISIVDSTGTIKSLDESLNGKNIADKEYYKSALLGFTGLTSVITDAAGKSAIVACAPITNRKYNGVIMAELDVQTYSNIIKNIKIGQTGNVFCIDKAGTQIANIRTDLVTGKKNFIEDAKKDSKLTSAANVYKKMVAGNTGTDIYSYDSGDRICYYAPLKGTDGWSYGVVAPVSEMTSSVWTTVIWMSVSAIVLIILGVICSFLIAKRISEPISEVCGKLERLSVGDLSSELIEVKAKDETGILASSLNTTVVNLRRYIQQITGALAKIAQGNMCAKIDGNLQGDFEPIQDSIVTITTSLNSVLLNIDRAISQVNSSSAQVSDGASLLSENTTKQAGAIEELSSTIFDITEKTSQNSENAAQASSITQSARAVAETGNGYMQEMLDSMNEISTASDNISRIIKVIEDISFQTNILALNAAVEAARAGEAGKGFAVVADEVRNLATKSAQAAKETTSLIEDTINKVEQGTGKANQVAGALNQIVEHVEKSNNMVTQIAKASKEQAAALDEVKVGINQITEAIQTNSATSEESAATSEEMRSQAAELKEEISQFILSDEEPDIEHDNKLDAKEDCKLFDEQKVRLVQEEKIEAKQKN